MGLASFVLLLILILLFHPLLLIHCFVNSMQPSCHDDERSALLHFKQSFVIDCLNRQDKFADGRPKTSSWNSGDNSSNCCSWDGVECDMVSGHVIGLDLHGSCLKGSIDSSSTLFHLVHLQMLDLGYNNFNFSAIPTAIGRFLKLKFLHLGSSYFYGQIPSQISLLSKLSYLDLSYNVGSKGPEGRLLKLNNPNLKSLVQNLTALDSLFLHSVDMPSQLADSLANLSSLTHLGLGGCGLYGPIPSSLAKSTQLSFLNLKDNSLTGYIPSSIQNLTQLGFIKFYNNQISGPIPSCLGNLTELTHVDLSYNELSGSIPPSLFKLKNLETLDLQANNLGGALQFDFFLKLRNLTWLSLGFNTFSFVFGDRNANATLPQLKLLSLASSNLVKFPDFLRYQNELLLLELSYNSIYGQIPQQIMNSSIESLEYIDLSNNLLTGFHHLTTTLPWVHLLILDLQSNKLQGQLPIPASSTEHYDVSNNLLSGEISPLICNLSSILVLDLSNNNLNGKFPDCLGNRSDSLLALNLRNNSFHGSIPLACKQESSLRMIDFSHNQFWGKLPRPLATCMKLEYLDFSFNQLNDTFPTWLGTLPELKVLSMRRNGFHGVIGKPQNTSDFAKLRIIDLSHNYFNGALPSEYLFIWDAMKAFKMSHLRYMNASENISSHTSFYDIHFEYDYSTTLVMKSVATQFGKIPENLAIIDLSSNKFSGQIPKSIGNLTALYSLNLSNNVLTGRIPPSLGKLTELESLDLSQNKLSGKIPEELTQLDFLQSFDVSHNNLTGPIPQGNQIQTFDNSSFEGNPGLCGGSLSKKCDNSEAPPRSPSAFKEDDHAVELDWKFILAGFISGLVIGVSVGDIVIRRTQLGSLAYICGIRLREMIRN